jgi:hypothetical protein
MAGHVGFVVDKVALGGRVCPSTSVSVAKFYFSDWFAFIINLYVLDIESIDKKWT